MQRVTRTLIPVADGAIWDIFGITWVKGAFMGAWGTGNVENDGAADMIDDIIASDSFTLVYDIVKSIEMIVADQHPHADEIDVDDAAMIIGAGEVIALRHGEALPDLSDYMLAWHEKTVLKADTDLIQRVLDAIKAVHINSELRDLWAESEDDEEDEASDYFIAWDKNVRDLIQRLEPITDS